MKVEKVSIFVAHVRVMFIYKSEPQTRKKNPHQSRCKGPRQKSLQFKLIFLPEIYFICSDCDLSFRFQHPPSSLHPHYLFRSAACFALLSGRFFIARGEQARGVSECVYRFLVSINLVNCHNDAVCARITYNFQL